MGEVRGVWYGGDVPLFQLNFRTKMGLKKMLENQSDLRKELMRKIISMLNSVFNECGMIVTLHRWLQGTR